MYPMRTLYYSLVPDDHFDNKLSAENRQRVVRPRKCQLFRMWKFNPFDFELLSRENERRGDEIARLYLICLYVQTFGYRYGLQKMAAFGYYPQDGCVRYNPAAGLRLHCVGNEREKQRCENQSIDPT